MTKKAKDQLTILVFKDNYDARTFKIPLRWISQFGVALALLLTLCLASLGVAVRYYRASYLLTQYTAIGGSDPAHTAELEKQLKDLQAAYSALEAAKKSTPAAAPAPPDAAATDVKPAPIVPPEAEAPLAELNAKPDLFRGLPAQIQPPPDPASVPIKIESPSSRWTGKTLKVHFALSYAGDRPGGQQGRIILLARGPGAILTHPNDVLHPLGHETLIDPNKGEYFSVSHYREVKAEFGPVPSRDWLQEVEIVILSQSGQLLIHDRIAPKSPGVSSEARVPRSRARRHADAAAAEPTDSATSAPADVPAQAPAQDTAAPAQPASTPQAPAAQAPAAQAPAAQAPAPAQPTGTAAPQ